MQSLIAQGLGVQACASVSYSDSSKLRSSIVDAILPQWHHTLPLTQHHNAHSRTPRCNRRPFPVLRAASDVRWESSQVFRYPGEHALNLSEYMVTLDKPLGLTLAPDPITGQIVVQSIQEGSPAAQSQMIQVGDVVKLCSAVFGEDMWQAIDIRRIRWAINNRTSQVKLVLERSRRPGRTPTWYSKGQAGRASTHQDVLQLPVCFNNASQDDWAQEMGSAGRPLMVAFHRSVLGVSQVQARSGAAVVARLARLQALREELAEARREPELDLHDAARTGGQPRDPSRIVPHATAALHRGSPSGPATNGMTQGDAPGRNGSHPLAGAAGSRAPGFQKGGSSGRDAGKPAVFKKVTPVLPWLLVTSHRLDTRDLTLLASCRGLGALLELGLSCAASGTLAVRGSDPNPPSSSSPGHVRVGSLPGLSPSPAAHPSQQPGAGVGPGPEGGQPAATAGFAGGAASHGSAGGDGSHAGHQSGRASSSPETAASGSSNSSTSPSGRATASGQSGPTTADALPAHKAGPYSPHPSPQPPSPDPSASPSPSSPTSPSPTSGFGGKGGPAAARSAHSPGTLSPSMEVRGRALMQAAAAIQRLAIRRRNGSLHRAPPEACAVLLHCEEGGMESEVACLFAGWLHWYCRMPLQEALLSAEIAMGCSVEQGVIECVTEMLACAAEERKNRVVLTWKYGGLTAAIAGDVVGDWGTRLPLVRCKSPTGCRGNTAQGNFLVEISGLQPGVYMYKYIVDGTWTVDPASPKVLDASGNWNNILEVHQQLPVTTSRERLALARWQAANLAWEDKLGLAPA